MPEWRRETFLDFFLFHLRYRAHPGCVYYLIPHLRETYGWDDEETLWYCVLNGNTQNPVTSLLLHREGPRPRYLPRLLKFWRTNRERLAWDTDRRYFRTRLEDSLSGYLTILRGETQAEFWGARAGNWRDLWNAAAQIPTFARLSAWSYLEYLYIAGFGADADNLMVGDPGSGSHRNGLELIAGHPWEMAPYLKADYYGQERIDRLAALGEELLEAAREIAAEHNPVRALEWPTRLTLESALCTYKSWHKPNRRYPNVYNDMLFERITAAEERWPAADLGVFWEARERWLPARLRLESTPNDPGRCSAKANHYRNTGEPIVMYAGTPYAASWDLAVEAGAFGQFR